MSYEFFGSRFLCLETIYKLFSKVSSWGSLNFLLSSKIQLVFNSLNLNRLKNLFLKRVSSQMLWNEIRKMIDVGLVGISGDFLFEKKFYLGCSFFSFFLLEIYLLEVDLYLLDLRFKTISFKDLIFPVFKLLSNDLSYRIEYFNFTPNKIERYLANFGDLLNLNCFRISKFYKQSSRSFNSKFSMFFFKSLDFVRYKYNLLLGVRGSEEFLNYLKSKLASFVRMSINMELSFVSYNFYLNVNFLGFMIQSSNFSKFIEDRVHKTFFSLDANIVHFLFLKLDNFKNKMSLLFLKRLNSELLLHVDKFLFSAGIGITSIKDKKFWTSMFQFEAVRSSQIYKLVNTSESNIFIPQGYFSLIKHSSLSKYRRYLFNIYLYKCRLMLNNISFSLFSFIDASYFSLDLFLSYFLMDFKKKVYLYYLTTKTSPFFNAKLNESAFFSSNLRNKDKFSKKLLIPFTYMCSRLRNLGFLHFEKYRPVSNSRFVQLKDKELIKTFGFLAYSFILCERLFYVSTFLSLNFTDIVVII